MLCAAACGVGIAYLSIPAPNKQVILPQDTVRLSGHVQAVDMKNEKILFIANGPFPHESGAPFSISFLNASITILDPEGNRTEVPSSALETLAPGIPVNLAIMRKPGLLQMRFLLVIQQ